MRAAAAISALLHVISAGSATADVITYVSPSLASNSNATWTSGGTNYTTNYGIAFTTGPSGPFDIDWVDVGLSTASSGVSAASLTVALHAATNSTPYSAVASATAYATDTVSFSMPATSATDFTLQLTSSDLVNISNYSLQSNTSYALILYAPSANFAIQRTSGIANGQTNNNYDVTNGFVMLDTFRNNAPNYTNTSGSYPTLAISFGANAASVPEPSVVGIGMILAAGGLAGRIRKRFRRGEQAIAC
jgi:hypothetical protein